MQQICETNNGELEFSDEWVSSNDRRIVDQKIISGGKEFLTQRTYSKEGLLLKEKDYRGMVIEYTYNQYGSRTKVTTYIEQEGIGSGNKIINEKTYTYSGNYVNGEADSRYYDSDGTMLKTFYNINEYSGLTNNVTMPNGQVINYGYDNAGEKLNTVSAMLDGEQHINGFTYNKNYLTAITHNGFNYEFEYDGLGRIINNKVAGESIYTKTYIDTDNEDREIYTYANGDRIEEVTDKYGRIIREYAGEETTPKIENIYSDTPDIEHAVVSGASKIYRTIDRYAGKVYNTEYDEYGEAVRTVQTDLAGSSEVITETTKEENRRS